MHAKVQPLMPDFGVEVSGVDLSRPLSPDQFSDLRNLYDQHSLLLFREQYLSPEDQARISHYFGLPKIETRKQFNFREYPEVSTIGNITDDDGKPLAFFARGGFGWHTDGSAACHVNAATLLSAVEVPVNGGDTMFLSTAAAWDASPPDLRDALRDVRVLASFHAHNDPLLEKDPESFIPLTPREREALPPVWHSVVQTHPVTGRSVYYLNFDPLAFDGVDDETGRDLLQQVLEIASHPTRIYRHRWSPGDLIIWDNHAMLHSGTPTHMYESDRRLMLRSFVYTTPTERPLPNYDEVSRIFWPGDDSISVSEVFPAPGSGK